MHKIRWFNAKYGASLASIGDNLAKIRFDSSEDDSEGIRLESRKPGAISGQFIQKESFLQKIVLPTGEEYEEPRSAITVTEFLLRSGDRLGLQLIDPPRRTLPFFNALSEASQFKFSCEPLEVDMLRWIGELEAEFGTAEVFYLDCNGVPLSDTTVGRFAFKGTKDVREEARGILRKRPYLIENARCNIQTSDGPLSIELFRNGAIKAPIDPSVGIVTKIRAALQRTTD